MNHVLVLGSNTLAANLSPLLPVLTLLSLMLQKYYFEIHFYFSNLEFISSDI
jgi:hypothetical protein